MHWGNVGRYVVAWFVTVLLALVVSCIIRPPSPGAFIIGLAFGLIVFIRAPARWPLRRD